MTHSTFDLAQSAREEMIHEGFHPDFPPAAQQQLDALKSLPSPQSNGSVVDLRHLLWSSIDNDTTRDLDQIEWVEHVPEGFRLLIGIADVDADVPKDSPIDGHAADQTVTVYTAVRNFPMLPEELSTNLTSLLEGADRLAAVVEMIVSTDGAIKGSSLYRALVRNQAQLTYNGIGPWLEGTAGAPPKVAASQDLQQQLKAQYQLALALRLQRHRLGALDFDRVEAEPVIAAGQVQDVQVRRKNAASNLIEDFMVAANEVMARTLAGAGVPSIRRVVRSPERWPRIVELAARAGETLPAQPDPKALNQFLQKQKTADPAHYADLSLAVIKLLGPGEYMLTSPSDPDQGHFGLATHDYTHSTAPNRRFADLVTQRLMKSVVDKTPQPYTSDALSAIARNCTLKEDAARKVERTMAKRMMAVALSNRTGQSFAAVVTGVTPKGVFVRVSDPPAEGRVMRGEQGLDVGDQIKVTLIGTDPQRGFVDFAH